MAQEMVMVIFNQSIESEMIEALRAAGMECYTKLVNAQGVGKCSEPRLDSHVWPGTNTIYLISVDADRKGPVLDAIKKMKDIHHEEGVTAFVLPVTSVI